MKQVILGTAGHIDHGKTTLVKALTGIDTDRLKEEKIRGITIELGFASLKLPSGEMIGVVDVPGHEKFVKHMVAGATGIDIVALVVAADEGVMPQTREHLEICELLKVKKGLVVLTKTDLVDDPDWLDLVKEDVRDFLKGTFLDGAPIISVSATEGEGLNELLSELQKLVDSVEPRPSTGNFRLFIDRVFTIKGFGTVVTGTSLSGHLKVGDPVMVYPQGLESKVRGLQVHNTEVNEVYSGQRTAINLQGLEKSSIERGNVVATPGSLIPTYMVDAYFEYLASNTKPLKNRSKARLHIGTTEIITTVVILGQDELAPGEAAYVQFRMDKPTTTLAGDRYILRSYSPIRTIGGGHILNPLPRKHKGELKRVVESLQILDEGTAEDAFFWHLKEVGLKGISRTELAIRTNLPPKVFEKHWQKALSDGQALLYDRESQKMVCRDAVDMAKKMIVDTLERFHRENPLKPGLGKEELGSKMPPWLESKLFNQVLLLLSKEGILIQDKEWVRLASHKLDLGKNEEKIKKEIEKQYLQSGLTPPFFKEVATQIPGETKVKYDVLDLLLEEGVLVKVKDDLYFHRKALEDLKERLIKFLEDHGEISPAEFKKLTRASRKFSIPLLEYFDSTRVTIRVGDKRVLRSKT